MYTNDVFPGNFMSMQPIEAIHSPHERITDYPTLAVSFRKTSDLSQYINPAANEKAAKAIRAHYGQVPADKYKTVMCQTWLETAKCRFGARCKFAHGESELRSNGLV
ncbi:zinc finger c-x8-C-x5-C-x3-H type (and similar) domain-containing protein [Ditylenchus destructor]|uniref:Zinc finger c-x8-C-x5-C-x3-H type (And similar) domain-containing protein n=1 Tax=Ditylenchus destructor TaxID=166010 RepID=A0AAD4QWK5_9BILA|nr:zinc finger c-x8-C-x5-C-x3-H type (and similar) domain-containing protein [Ditylenchus destructor]